MVQPYPPCPHGKPVGVFLSVSGPVHLQRDGLQLSYICKVSCLEIYQVR